MPRQKRLLSNSGIYHIMLRSNEGKDLFYDDDDRKRFLDTISRMGSNKEYEILSYCLMSNHVHLLLREGEDPLHRSLKRVTVSYVYYFNHKYRRTGHLFQDRFKSERIEDDSYLISCTRYIHNNPVKAGLALRAEQYKWSSFRQYISSNRDSILKVNREFVLDLYSQDTKKAVKYFLKDSDNECQNDFLEYNDTRAESHRKSWDEICGDIRKKYDLGIDDIKGIENKALRNEIINGIKESTELSLNELSEIIGLSKYIIYRA